MDTPETETEMLEQTETETERAATRAKAEERVILWRGRLGKLEQQIADGFAARKSATVGCRGCKSILNHEALMTSASLTNPPSCPVCGGWLVPEKDIVRIGNLKARILKAEAALAEAQQPTAPPVEGGEEARP